MTTENNIFSALQAAIKTRLEANTLFQGDKPIHVMTEQIGDLENEIEKQINEIGLNVLLITPNVEMGGIILQNGKVTLLVGITEDVLINQGDSGTKKANGDVAAAVISSLMNFDPGNGWAPLIVRRCSVVSNSPLLVREVIIETNGILRAA